MDCSAFLEFFKSIKPVEPNELQVVVVRAEGLRPANESYLGGAGNSDPYVVLKMGRFFKILF